MVAYKVRSDQRQDRQANPAAIRKLAEQIVQHFSPERIILFGSHAHGSPTADSDVDLLVVMPTAHETRQATRIRQATEHPFPLDLIVRTPGNLARRLEWGDRFLQEAVTRGRVLY